MISPADAAAIHDAACAVTIGFYRAVDLREDGVENFFTEDAHWNRLGTALHGREAIRVAMAQRPATRTTCHLVNNLLVSSAAADQAHSRYFVAVYEGTPESPLRMLSILAGEDKLVRTDAGWKIKYRSAHRHLTAAPPVTAAR
jgi:hypothetical protein